MLNIKEYYISEYEINGIDDVDRLMYQKICDLATGHYLYNQWLTCEGSKVSQEENMAFMILMGEVIVSATVVGALPVVLRRVGWTGTRKFVMGFTVDLTVQVGVKALLTDMSKEEIFEDIDYSQATTAGLVSMVSSPLYQNILLCSKELGWEYYIWTSQKHRQLPGGLAWRV